MSPNAGIEFRGQVGNLGQLHCVQWRSVRRILIATTGALGHQQCLLSLKRSVICLETGLWQGPNMYHCQTPMG